MIHLNNHWKLVHENHIWKIHNEKGKDLTYDPNSGIQILVEDGYAFKDLNKNGIIDPFEDWRLPMKDRVLDFSKRYQLTQTGHFIYYKKGVVHLPEWLLHDIEITPIANELMAEDEEFMREHYMLAMLLLMFDHDVDQNLSDYIIELFIDSLDMGMLDHVFYTIKNAVLSYLKHSEASEQLALDLS